MFALPRHDLSALTEDIPHHVLLYPCLLKKCLLRHCFVLAQNLGLEILKTSDLKYKPKVQLMAMQQILVLNLKYEQK